MFSELANIEFTRSENSNWCLLLPDSNLFLKFQNNFTAEFWATFSYGLLLQRFFWNSSGIFLISINADTRNFSNKYQHIFLLDAIFFEQWGRFKRKFSKRYIYHQRNRNIWYYCRVISVAKFLSHRAKNEKVMTKTSSQLNAPLLMTERP